MRGNLTKEECRRRLEELEAEADRRGCCVVPATPVPDPGGIPEEGRP